MDHHIRKPFRPGAGGGGGGGAGFTAEAAGKQAGEGFGVPDVATHESISVVPPYAMLSCHIGEAFQVAGVSETIQVDDADRWITQ